MTHSTWEVITTVLLTLPLVRVPILISCQMARTVRSRAQKEARS